MKKVSLTKLTKGARKGLLSNFRKEERGAITLEIAIALSFLGFGFVGLLSAVTTVDTAHSGEQALNDMVMTVRAMPDVDARSDSDLITLFGEIATDHIRSSHFTVIDVNRSCGCPLENAYGQQICSVSACNDGAAPARYLDLAMLVRPVEIGSNDGAVNTFSYNASVRY